MNVNLRAVFLCAREAARRMMANGVAGEKRGRIINIASVHSTAMLPGIGAYCASRLASRCSPKIMARVGALGNRRQRHLPGLYSHRHQCRLVRHRPGPSS